MNERKKEDIKKTCESVKERLILKKEKEQKKRRKKKAERKRNKID